MFNKSVHLLLLLIYFLNCYLINCSVLNSSSSTNQINLTNSKNNSKSKSNKVILILADGVRYDYLNDLTNLKGFQRLASNGVKSFVSPVFPSNSYPNWFSILTGLYAENHGMVQNFMHDEKHNETFLMTPISGSHHEFWWNNDGQTEPLWTTAEKKGLKTAVYWWDGCSVKISNILPTKCVQYQSYWTWPNLKDDFKNAFDTILDNFKQDKWQLALLYYEAIDSTGHVFGPNSISRKDALKDLDDLLVYLQDEMKRTNLDDQVHLVVVSDHGMLSVQSKKENAILIDIDNYLDEDDVEVMLDRGAMAFIIPKPNKEEKIINELKKANVKGMNFFRKEDIPEKYHFKHHRRISEIMLTADKGYFIRGFRNDDKTKPTWDVIYKGHHGYDPYTTDEMKTIMFGSGPKLKKNYLNSQLMMMTDHYNLICRLLELDPLQNDGNVTNIISMIDDGTNSTNNLANQTIKLNKPKFKKPSRAIKRESNYSQTKNSSNSLDSFKFIINLFIILLISQFRI